MKSQEPKESNEQTGEQVDQRSQNKTLGKNGTEKTERQTTEGRSFIKEAKQLINNRKPKELTQETLLPILDSFLARLQSPKSDSSQPPNANTSEEKVNRVHRSVTPLDSNSKESVDNFIFKTLQQVTYNNWFCVINCSGVYGLCILSRLLIKNSINEIQR